MLTAEHVSSVRQDSTTRAAAIICFGIVTLAALSPGVAAAATKTWKAPVNGSWSDGTKWVPVGAPVDGDQVVITVAGNYTVTLDVSRTLGSLTVGQPSGTTTQTLNIAGQTLALNGASTIKRRGVLVQASGTLFGLGTLSVSGTYNWSGGKIDTGGKVSILADGVANISGTDEKLMFNGGTLNNRGMVLWTGSGVIHGRGGRINNFDGGLFEARNDTQMAVGGGEGDGLFTNDGTFRKIASTGVTTIGAGQGFTLINNGKVEIKSGTLQLSNTLSPHGNTGSIIGAPGTTLNFVGGPSSFAGVVNVPTVTFTGGATHLAGLYTSTNSVISGGRADFDNATPGSAVTSNFALTAGALGGTGGLRVSKTFDWTGGAVSGSGGHVDLVAASVTTIHGADTLPFFTYTINNAGTATWSGVGSIIGGGAARFNNLENALFDARNDALMGVGGGSGDGYFTNSGIFRKSNSAGVTSFGAGQGFTFSNTETGVVQINSGTLRLDSTLGSHTNTGVITGQPGTTLLFGSGTSDFSAGSIAVPTVTFSGGVANIGASYAAASTVVNGGTANVNTATASSVNVVLSAGNLGGSGVHNVTGDFDWTGGAVSNGGGTIVLGSDVVMNINGPAEKGFLTQTLRNFGVINWNGGNINGAGGHLDNAADGLVEIHSDAFMFVDGGRGDGVINNAGTFRKKNSTGTTTIGGNQGFNLKNTGRVEALSGTLNFQATFFGPALVQTAGVTTLQGGSLAGVPLQFDGGELIGTGTITGTVNNNHATVAPGFSAGKINIVGDYTQSHCGTLEIEIGGLSNPGTTFDRLAVSGTAQLAGTLRVSTIDGFKPAGKDTVQAVTGGNITGTFEQTNSQVNYASNAATVAALAKVPARLLNISTRMRVLTGDQVLIGGFIITGTTPKKVIVRGIGPDLAKQNIEGPLPNPTLELFDSHQVSKGFNDDWQDTQKAAIEATLIPPKNDLESAIVATLLPGSYTAVLSGEGGSTGVGLVEVYDLDQSGASKVANISTRGSVLTGDKVMIGGFIAGGGAAGGMARVIIRASGPSLPVTGTLADPMLDLFNGDGTKIATNNNWRDTQQGEIEATLIPPADDRESAMVQTLAPGAYTAVVSGVGETTGIALVEVYNLDEATLCQ